MSVVALVTWILTGGGGLFLLAIWLIEYDHDYQHSAATRLPVPVLSAHVLLALTGLAVWVGYLVLDSRRLALAAAVIVVTGAALGLVMAARWLGVYRAFGRRPRGDRDQTGPPAPPERNFPLPVVIAHGAFAFVTVALVVLTAAGIGGS